LKSVIIAILWMNEISPALMSALQHTSICHLKTWSIFIEHF